MSRLELGQQAPIFGFSRMICDFSRDDFICTRKLRKSWREILVAHTRAEVALVAW